MNHRIPLVQWSLGELVVVVTVATVVVGSLWAPMIFFQLAMILLMLIASILVVILCIGSGYLRTFCIGFASAVGVYLLALILVESPYGIFVAEDVRLPTTTIWAKMQPHITQIRAGSYPRSSVNKELIWQDDSTLKDVDGNHYGAVRNLDLIKSPIIGQQYIDFAPSLNVFYAIGQSVWLLTLGYLGGKFAVGFQRFQHNQETSPTTVE
ncbi:hypothetical protein AB1K70_01750 [Bremerella sp. JC770]|uniref:hypothetical protein n=1 Tax=Bremerella sp. JC770 TaxID=3232137 RepID=UPI0034576C96